MGTLPTRRGLEHVSQVGRPAQGRPWSERRRPTNQKRVLSSWFDSRVAFKDAGAAVRS
jgi:hypothetical protein